MVNLEKLLEQYPAKDYSPKWDPEPNPDFVYKHPTEEERLAVSFSNPFLGMKHTEETLKKMRKPKKNKENYRGPKSASHRKAISEAQKGVPWTENDWKSRTATCPHCGVTGIKSNITRWHKKCRGEG